MTDTVAARSSSMAAYRAGVALRRYWPAVAIVAFTIVLPWLFHDWNRGRHSGFAISLISQMGLMTIFALSFNMQMGQAGLLSFGHAVFLGLGGYVTVHALNAIGGGSFWLPMELVPLIGGLSGLIFAAVPVCLVAM